MLSYRHGFHAGNFADVFKHFILVYLLNKLKALKPFSFIDPFAAAGKYSLEDPFMNNNKEYLNGISKVLNADISDPLIKNYLDLVRKTNPNKLE
jgi:23S rRNA (adenine2030-N6)-methyltransferase